MFQLTCGQGLTSAKRARLTPGNASNFTFEGPAWRVKPLRPALVPATRLSPVDRCSVSVDASRHEPIEPADSSADCTSDSGSKLPAAVDLGKSSRFKRLLSKFRELNWADPAYCEPGAWTPHHQGSSSNVHIKLKFLRHSERFLGMYISKHPAAIPGSTSPAVEIPCVLNFTIAHAGREDATQIWYTLHDKHRVSLFMLSRIQAGWPAVPDAYQSLPVDLHPVQMNFHDTNRQQAGSSW